MSRSSKQVIKFIMIVNLVLIPFQGVVALATSEIPIVEESLVLESELESPAMPAEEEENEDVSLPVPESEPEESEDLESEESSSESEESSSEPEESETENPEVINLTLNRPLDDNTLYLKGVTAASHTIVLRNPDGQEVVRETSETDGSFTLKLPQVFEAGQRLTLQVLNEETMVLESFYTVQAAGLNYTVEIEEELVVIRGTTSPNRQLILEDSTGGVLSESISDEIGHYQLELRVDQDLMLPLVLHILDEGEIVRTTEVVFEMEAETPALVQETVSPVAMSVQGATLPISNKEFVITSITHTANGTTFAGSIYKSEAEESLKAIFKRALIPLFGIEAQYFITVNNSSVRTNVINNQFSVSINESLRAGSEISLNLKADGKYSELILIIPITKYFSNQIISSIALTIPGNKFEKSPTDIALKQTIKYQENTLITREQSSDANEATSNYNVTVFDNTKSSWKLTAQAVGPLTNKNGKTLENALYFKSGDSLQSLERTSVEVGAKSAPNPTFLYTFSWPPSEGIVVQTNPFFAEPDTTYSTAIRWTISNVP